MCSYSHTRLSHDSCLLHKVNLCVDKNYFSQLARTSKSMFTSSIVVILVIVNNACDCSYASLHVDAILSYT